MSLLPSARILAVIFSLLVSQVSRADTPAICEGKLFSTCLQILLYQRCAMYSGYNPLSKREWFCEKSVEEFVEVMDIVHPQDEVNVLVFSHSIGGLITNPVVQKYLSDIPVQIESSIKNSQPFRLWDFTVARAGTPQRANKWLAILFQDTNANADVNIVLNHARVNLGKKGERKLSQKELKIWQAAIESVSHEKLSAAGVSPESIFVRPYPRIDTEFLNAGFYHFYFNAYTTQLIQGSRQSKTDAGKDMNAFVPFLLNALYEMHYDIEPKLSMLKDPHPFPLSKKKIYSVRDLYTSYLGSLFGFGGAELVAKAEAFAPFAKRISSNPKAGMTSLYKNFLPKAK